VQVNKSFVPVLFLLKGIARRVVTASIGGFLPVVLATTASLAQTPPNTPEITPIPLRQPSAMPDQLRESPYAGGEGLITGRIVQGTVGAAAPVNHEVTLMAYTNLTPVSVFTTTIDATGRFTFEQASTSPDVAYYVGATYHDIVYGSELFALSAATPTVDLTIPVYETTTDINQLRFNRVQYVAYRVWNGALAEPTQLSITLQNLIQAGGVDRRLAQAQSTPVLIRSADAPSSSTIPPVFAGIAMAALVLVIGGGILYWKYSRDAVQTLYALRREKERLLTELSALDARHDQGDIDDETWSAERVTLMNSLRKVSDSLEQIPQSRKRG
jgi:hypothetical protein